MACPADVADGLRSTVNDSASFFSGRLSPTQFTERGQIMKRKLPGLIIMGLFVLTFVSPAPAQEQTAAVASWDFDVYLNDKKVGSTLLRSRNRTE